jgi:CobQ-like glutamine amidotransferase family enzyme
VSASPARGRRLRLAHLFPDLLGVYGDAGNVRTLVVRAEARGIEVGVAEVCAGARSMPAADVFLIGGGQDREQVVVASELRRLAAQLRTQIEDGAAVLAICAGYQMLGRTYRLADGSSVEGAGLLALETVASPDRLVGPAVARLDGWPDEQTAERTVVGFENHSGRTTLDPSARPLATVEIGAGNNGTDGTEGVLAPPGADGMAGLRVGTYLHGPLLPRNPHLADALIAAGLARGGPQEPLAPLDDTAEWQAHRHHVERLRAAHAARERVPARLRRIIDPARNLIGF